VQPPDNIVVSFETVISGAKGRIVRLGGVADTILKRHDYPEPASHAAGQALALIAMLGAPISEGSRLSLQTRTNGPLRFLFADMDSDGRMRATASFDKAVLTSLAGQPITQISPSLFGEGHMALTLEAGPGQDPRQGIVSIDNGTLEQTAEAYFAQSEQLPTFVRLVVAKHYVAGEWAWRAGGLMVQDIKTDSDDDNWNRVRVLASTIEDHELLDPTLAPEALLLRLFHEEGVAAFPPKSLNAHCTCSRAKVEGLLKSFGSEQLSDMKDDNQKISVTCEFCSTTYAFDAADLNE
jgi:molecular chaperone Hsp33